jgi:serine/threonine protein phosphatase PrpC
MFITGGYSDVGTVRSSNEDVFGILPELGFILVADGMGGHAAGEVAARLAREAMEGFIVRSQENPEFTWPFGIAAQLSYDGNRLRTAMHLANRRVFKAAESSGEFTGMGTTVVAALASPHALAVGHLGDSRLYVISGAGVTQVTRDDSWIELTLEANVELTREELATHPMRHVLTEALGARENIEPHIAELTPEAGDWIVLSSDGMHGVLQASEIGSIVTSAATPQDASLALVRAALAAGSRDNATAVVARWLPDA